MSAIPIFDNMNHPLFNAIKTNNANAALDLLATLDMADQANETALLDGLHYAVLIGNTDLALLIREHTFLDVDAGLASALVQSEGVEEAMRLLGCDAAMLLQHLSDHPSRFEYAFDWLYSRDLISHETQTDVMTELGTIIQQLRYNLRRQDNQEMRELLNAYEASLAALWRVVERYDEY
jgi:hypothetical protein